MGSGILCISTQSKHIDEAWKFVKFACGKEGEKNFGRNNIPSIKEIAYANFSTPPPDNIAAVIDQMEEVHRLNLYRRSWSLEFYKKVYILELEKLFLGKQTIEETVNNITSGAKEFLEEG